MEVNYFVYNGESSLDHGMYIGGQRTFNAPQRDVTKVAIPGKNGDLIKDNGRWLNINVPYNIVIMDEFKYRADEVRAWLCEPKGYARLEDTYHPESFRLARFGSSIDFATSAWNKVGRASIVFDCMPQRFLKSGENFEAVSNGLSIFNPTRYPSKPIVRVTCSGSGSVIVNGYEIELTDISTYVDIDSELQDCYVGQQSYNNKVALGNGFPLLKSGRNVVFWSSGVSAVEIMGRWYTV